MLIARLGLGHKPVRALPDIHPFTSRRVRVRVAGITALAASIALAIIAVHAARTSTSTLVRVPNGPPTASGMLAASLSNQLAGEPGRVSIGLSFRTQHGICRTFRSDHGVSGIGCRDGDRWLVPMMTSEDPQTSTGTSTAYRLASGDFPPAVMEEVDRRIKGEPLSAVDEEQQRQRGWR